jgi:hypothetical protein
MQWLAPYDRQHDEGAVNTMIALGMDYSVRHNVSAVGARFRIVLGNTIFQFPYVFRIGRHTQAVVAL